MRAVRVEQFGIDNLQVLDLPDPVPGTGEVLIVEAQWAAERRGLERFRTQQPPYSLLNRGIEAEVLPAVQRHGMGALVWGPLAQGRLTGRVRKGQQNELRRAAPRCFGT